MNSRYKYRGKRVDSGEWVKGWHIVVEEHHFITTKDARLDYEEDADTYLVFRGIVEVIPESVGQYTGITIKNVDLWQDDIVKMKNGMLNIIYVGQARTDEPYEFKLQALDKSGFTFDFRNINEIIGNVHDGLEGKQ